MTIKPDPHPENEIARTSKTGPVCVGCYPHCRSNTACAIARREGKAKGGNKGKETRGLRTCRTRLELIGSDKSGRVVKHAGADERRERKRGPQLPVFQRGRARGIYKFRVREGDNVRYAGRKMRSGKKVNPEGPTRVFCRRHRAASYVKGGRCSV